jgi:parallel beta-helix repeat protein
MRLVPSLTTLVFCSFAATATAADKNVSTVAELEKAIAAAKPGDTIVLAAGKYPMKGATCAANGSSAMPITVKSSTPLAAQIELDALEGFKVTGGHWHFEGLDIRGVCANDGDCEHAFHVTGGKAEGFVLRKSRVRDFNAQLKVNGDIGDGGKYQAPHGGLVEYCELNDTHPRNTGNPTTKLNINTGDGWIVRGNTIRDFKKGGGDQVSYGAFMKGGSKNGLFERNLVVCSKDDKSGGTRIGLSFGGGGTGAEFCAPAFNPNVPCSIEHTGGVMRNNIIVSCSDVGIYLNRAKDTSLFHNTLVATGGVDFRFDTTSGLAHGNVMMSKIRQRDGGTFTGTDNLVDQPLSFFTSLYANPLELDFNVKGDASALQQGPAKAEVKDDYCARARPPAKLALGALEHSLGNCTVVPPPEGSGGGSPASSSAGTGSSAASGAGATTSAGVTTGAAGGASPADEGGASSGCSCQMQRARTATGAVLACIVSLVLGARRGSGTSRRSARATRP